MSNINAYEIANFNLRVWLKWEAKPVPGRDFRKWKSGFCWFLKKILVCSVQNLEEYFITSSFVLYIDLTSTQDQIINSYVNWHTIVFFLSWYISTNSKWKKKIVCEELSFCVRLNGRQEMEAINSIHKSIGICLSELDKLGHVCKSDFYA